MHPRISKYIKTGLRSTLAGVISGQSYRRDNSGASTLVVETGAIVDYISVCLPGLVLTSRVMFRELLSYC